LIFQTAVRARYRGTQREEENMVRPAQRVAGFLARDDGPTATEYAVMLAMIVVVAVAAIQTLGSNVNSAFDEISDEAFGD
jgi:pilus assembly protein Flp/PilA